VVGKDAPVLGILCFVGADWPLFGGAFAMRGVTVLWPKRLYPQLKANGPIGDSTIDRLHRSLAKTLPAA